MMDMQKTLKILSEKCNDSKRGKYWRDAADYSFRSHVLKLLSRIAKKKIDDEPVHQPQESGKNQFKCKNCEGAGYTELWDEYEGKEAKFISDCPQCKGEGYITLEVVDNRKKTKDKDLYYNEEY